MLQFALKMQLLYIIIFYFSEKSHNLTVLKTFGTPWHTTAENGTPGTLRNCKFLVEVQKNCCKACRVRSVRLCPHPLPRDKKKLRAEIAPHPYMYYMSTTCICLQVQLVQLCLTYTCTSVVSAVLSYLQVHFCRKCCSVLPTSALLPYLQVHLRLTYKCTSVLPVQVYFHLTYKCSSVFLSYLQVHFCLTYKCTSVLPTSALLSYLQEYKCTFVLPTNALPP